MRRRMAVSTDDCETRLRQSQFRTDHMNDAAPGIPHAIKLDAEFGAVFLQLAYLCDGQRTGVGHILAHRAA